MKGCVSGAQLSYHPFKSHCGPKYCSRGTCEGICRSPVRACSEDRISKTHSSCLWTFTAGSNPMTLNSELLQAKGFFLYRRGGVETKISKLSTLLYFHPNVKSLQLIGQSNSDLLRPHSYACIFYEQTDSHNLTTDLKFAYILTSCIVTRIYYISPTSL